MAENVTYDSLFNDLVKYPQRGSTTQTDPNYFNQIPRIIMMGQQRLAKEAKTLISQDVLTDTLTVGEPVIQKPNRWRATLSFKIGTGTGFNTTQPVFLRSYNYCRNFWPDPTVSGTPKYYADYDFEHWLVAPTPDQAYPVEIVIQEEVVPIDETQQTNFYTLYAPDLLVHACLLEAANFLKNADMIQVEQGWYDRLLQAVNFEQAFRVDDRSQKGDK